MRPILLASCLAAALVLAGCGGGSDETGETTGIAAETGIVELPETEEAPPAETAEAEAPFQITVPAGAPIGPTSPPKAIRQLQRALLLLGYEIGTPDGIWGPKTRKAVLAFQRKHKLGADGLVGAKTARAINRELKQV